MSSVPVSQYEALRAEMRSLVQQTQQVQEIATQVISIYSNSSISSTNHQIRQDEIQHSIKPQPWDLKMESLVLDNVQLKKNPNNINNEGKTVEGETMRSEDECGRVPSTTQMSVSSEPISQQSRPMNALYHGTWPVERTMWNSEPNNLNPEQQQNNHKQNMDQQSVLSFASSSGGAPLDRVLGSPEQLSRKSMQQFEAKVDMVYSLLAMLGGQEHADMGDTLLALSTSPESCLAMRQSGCIPLLVQLVQSDKDLDTRKKASQALHNLVHAQTDERLRKRETRVLKLLEQARKYTEALKNNTEYEPDVSSSSENQENSDQNDKHPVLVIANLMKHSFDEGHRQAICQLGGIHIIASLVEIEHALHGSVMDSASCTLLRRYACMALTNLTFGDSGNKALLCSFREFMRALVIQLQSPSDELRQVTASVLRNLSWRADPTSKEILREVGTVTGLMKAGMATGKENTLKSILSALWNLSAHCTENKLEICAVEGGLGFLVDMLSYKAPSKSLSINENAGGILRNISSQIAVRDDYREILRKFNCLQILLEQLKSPSLTIVSNACGTLWNLSAKNQVDQEALWQMGAPAMLRSLNHSKHKMIATGSSAALKNLLNSRPSHSLLPQMDSTARAMDLPVLPTLGARKQKALMRDLDQNLSETFENIERDSPTKVSRDEKLLFERTEKFSGSFLNKRTRSSKNVVRSESHEFISHNDLVYESRTTRSEASNQGELCNGFASLNLNEPSTSYQKELRNSNGGGRISGQYSGSSLVYVNQAQRKGTYIPLRNNYSDEYPDDIDSTEQPIDYSRKYSETKLPTAAKPQFVPTPTTKEPKKEESTKPLRKDSNYGIYAETDLDQPTDYSLRYAEDDSDDEDICDKIRQKDGNEFGIQDTLKTYCTEGTPYETPLNFSNATSMSDLRIDAEKTDIDNDKNKDKDSKVPIPTLSHLDEKDHCSVEDISEIDNTRKPSEKPLKSELSSGLMSPEKPVNYCEEGTPGYFSRVSSFGSLNSIPVNETEKTQQVEVVSSEVVKSVEEKVDASPCEAKAVKFVEPTVNYAEQTPLMFSRSSSLASLDSVEQHSIHDDRSSVVSDFSRLTSGIVSPSELPDSPTQTVPPSPRPRKGLLEYPSTSRNGTGNFLRGPDGRPQPAPRTLHKPSVFEDNITKFKEESTPIQFSTATSISSLTIDDQDEPVCGDLKNATPSESCNGTSVAPGEEGAEKQDTEQEKRDSSSEFNEQLSENDEDDDILADCINIGMQNNRHRQSKSSSPPTSKIPAFKPAQRPAGSGIPLPRKGIPTRCSFPQQTQRPKPTPVHSDTVRTYCTEDTPAVLSQAGSNSDLSVLSIQTDNKSKKDYLSDDSSNLSGDNDNILAECIQSGMPKAKVPKDNVPKRQIPSRKLQTSTPIKPFTRNEHFEDKKRFASGYLAAKDEVASFAVENSPCQFSLRSSLSDLTVDGSIAGLTRTVGEGETEPTTSQSRNLKPGPSLHDTGNENLISRQESLSSLSVESFGSMETEQALLEQCISSGMPKSKNVTCVKPVEKEKPIGVATKQFNAQKTLEIELCRRQEENDKSSKNANAASVAGNIKPIKAKSPEIPATATDVDTANQKIGLALKIKTDHHGTGHNQPMKTIDQEIKTDTSPDKLSPTDVNLSTDLTKNGSEIKTDCSLTASTYSNSDNCQNISDIKNVVDNRMLDPEAMIESLDRFTAELVSQASSHLQNKEENKYATSVTEGDTWNDDTSPNDVTFPSISGSPPNVITFSDSSPHQKPTDEIDGLKSNDFSSSTLTESTLIAMEATKMATTFQQEAELSLSVASLELDQVQPPSQMNSLTSSAFESVRKSPKLVARKRSLPVGLMVKRALNNSLCQGSSLESLENNSLSNLDHINPPSAMADLLDMEGSMVSVASLSSEIADFQINGKVTEKFQQPNPIFNVKQPANMLHLLTHSSNVSITDNLENVNPPSIFNEITDMCNSLADVETENIDTELFEDCNTNVQTENDATEMYSDANSMTPIQSDLSSSETTPKKVKTLSRQLTPKQKRILLKERYKTYTVAAEMMRGEQDKLMDSKEDDTETEDYKTVACHTESYKTVENYSTATYTRSPSKSTPKERRQNDPARFQTQVLDKAVTELLLETTPPNSDSNNSNNNSPQQSPAKSRISIRRNFNQKRLENKDRFKTQTITEASISPSPPPTDLHYLVQKEANMVLKTLSETKSKPDEFLDCETLSLVSNEDDSEHNSGSSTCRTIPKSLSNGPAIPVVQQTIPSRISSESNTTEEEIETEEKPVNINYGTYHKSWSNGPKVEGNPRISSDLENYQPEDDIANSESEEEEEKPIGKPKIIKPSEKVKVIEEVASDEGKGIRGRRKPLYSKANANNKMTGKSLKPIKSVTSNLVKNVSSSLKSSANIKVVGKPPPIAPAKGLKPPTNYTKPKSSSNSPKGSPVRTVNNKSPKHTAEPNKAKPVLERQGTFTKEDKTPKSKIPSAIPKTTSRIAKAIPVKTPSKIQTFANSNSINRTGLVKSASTDRANKPTPNRLQNRSPSADSRTQKTTPPLPQKDKKQNNNPSSKQITSRIASLWKKVEESKKQPTKKDTRVWIQNEENLEATTSEDGRPLVRSNTFEGKPEVILRTRAGDEVDETKRVSRLGSFLVVDEDDINGYNYDSPELSF